MTTPAEQEAERRYPAYPLALRRNFVEGVEWSESRHRELLEAAREYRDACDKVRDARAFTDEWYAAAGVRDDAEDRLLAAAAALEEA